MIFTDEQVKNINEFQNASLMHPFTCGNHCGATLVATNDGLHCPTEGCGYTQDWCHAFMADGSAVAHFRRSMPESMRAALAERQSMETFSAMPKWKQDYLREYFGGPNDRRRT